jgi:DNA-binding winged helix-turn-helix (wHTH) protein
MTDLIKPRLRFGPFAVDLVTRELRKSGTRIKLSGQPFEILAALLEHPGQLVTRDYLRKRVWSEDTFVDFGHGLNAAVNKLREALCDSPDDPRYIETLPRRGYRFIAQLENIEEVNSVPAPGLVSAQSNLEAFWKGSLIDHEWGSTVPVKRQTLVQAGALLTLVTLLAVSLLGFWSRWPGSPSMQKAELPRKGASEPSVVQEQEMESHTKQAAESLPSGGRSLSPPAGTEQTVKRVPQLPLADDIPILRLERSGQHLRLFEERSASDPPAILRFDLAHPDDSDSLQRIVAGQEAVAGPQPSPDGKRLVFTAGRIDAMEIWVCNLDGSSPKVLTNMGRTGTPRWSPDSRWIAFDSDGRFGRSAVYVVSANGGPVRAVVAEESNNSVPSWSHDGKYIYFASNRGQGWQGEQVWKVPAEGGQPVPVTRQGGFSAYESADGQWLYYAKSRFPNPEIWQVPVNGGIESRIPLLHPSTWASWALTKKGILLLSEYSNQRSELQYFDFTTRSVHPLVTLEKASFWLSASTDGSSIWYSELTDNQANQVFKAGLD